MSISNSSFTETPSTPQVIVPVNGVAPTLVPVTINASAGDQNDPHISGDLVAYASDFSLRYYSFATNTDTEILARLGSGRYRSSVLT